MTTDISRLNCTSKNAMSNSRVLFIEHVLDSKLPFICLIGEMTPTDGDGFGTNTVRTGGAVICGIMKYFSRYCHKRFRLNVVGIINVVETSMDLNMSLAELVRYVHQRYNPRYGFSIAAMPEVDVGGFQDTNDIAYIKTCSHGLMSRIKHSGEESGEIVSEAPSHHECLVDRSNHAHIDIIHDVHCMRVLGNGVGMGIHLVRNLEKQRRKRGK